jgi:hypothetical protein
MKRMNRLLTRLFLFFFLFVFVSCQQAARELPDSVSILDEHPIVEIDLMGPVTDARAEISGMAWCGDHLILLPQYPDRFGGDDVEVVFSIPESQLEDYLMDKTGEPIQPIQVPFDSLGFSDLISGFEGFEAVAFHDDVFFITVEARMDDGMIGYLIKGRVEGDCARLVLDPDTYVAIETQADLSNMSDETIILYQDKVYTIYEANGTNVNPQPTAHVFDLSLKPLGEISLPNIEYRLTDATVVDEEGRFWAINYYFPGDTKLKPAEDQIALAYGMGTTHQYADAVERLVAFEFSEEGIQLAGLPPMYLALEGDTKNWEGIVRFGEGFLLVTDEYPTTILAFIHDAGN